MKQIFKILIWGILLLTISLSIYLKGFYWDSVTSKVSPQKEYIIHEYKYGSDTDLHAPYGSYLYIQPSSDIKPGYEGHLIFAGYCNKGLKYYWLTNSTINIICSTNQPNNIRTESNKVYGIKISVNSKTL